MLLYILLLKEEVCALNVCTFTGIGSVSSKPLFDYKEIDCLVTGVLNLFNFSTKCPEMIFVDGIMILKIQKKSYIYMKGISEWKSIY